MKKLIIITLILTISTCLFTACQNRQNLTSGQLPNSNNTIQTTNPDKEDPAIAPTLSTNDNLDTLEQELNQTQILEEDFTDLNE